MVRQTGLGVRLDRELNFLIQADPTKFAVVKLRDLSSCRRPTVEMRKLHLQDSGLDFVEPKIAADKLVSILRAHSMMATKTQPLGKLFVAANDQAGVAGGTEVFGRIKAETTGITDCSRFGGAVFKREFCADGLGSVLDQNQIVLAGDGEHFVHVATQTEKVSRYERDDGLPILVHQFAFDRVAK